MRIIFFFISLLLTVIPLQAENWLFRDGESDYVIVVSPNASLSEKTAAKELRDYIGQMSGVWLSISNKPALKGKHIFVGFSQHVGRLTKKSCPTDTAESFVYQTIGNDLLIYGGRNAGTAYGVYTFLEKELGIRWYSSDFTKVPHIESYELPLLNHSESPAFRYRHVMYYQLQHHIDLNVHNKLNLHYGGISDEVYGKLPSFWGGHTFSLLVPPEKYFNQHPEYFSLRDNRRVENGQLCLSNPDVIELLKRNIIQIVREAPGYFAYGITQNDNQLYCECESCKALEQKYQSHAGLLLWAVNQVAEAVEKEIPGTQLVTFSYQYTRKAPKGIKPRQNVIVRLCDIECCFLHPIEETQENAPFMKDLKDWSKLTDRLHMFDYVTGFWQYMAPYPNYQVLAKNLQTFRKHHVIGVMELGQYQSEGGEFAEMKQWILSKLLWDPNQDVNVLAKEFIADYYGPAARDVQKYYDLCCHQVKPNTHMKFDAHHKNSLYTDKFVKKGRKLLDNALKTCWSDSVYTQRVEHVLGQILFLQSQRDPVNSKFDGTLKKLNKMVERDGIYVREHLKPKEYLQQSGYI